MLSSTVNFKYEIPGLSKVCMNVGKHHFIIRHL